MNVEISQSTKKCEVNRGNHMMDLMGPSYSDNPSGSTLYHYDLPTAKVQRIEKERTLQTDVFLYESKRTFDALQLFDNLRCFQLKMCSQCYDGD